jgi:hypothetical protein
MDTASPSSAEAEEICGALEHAVLKYFPHPAENADAFLFAGVDGHPADADTSA